MTFFEQLQAATSSERKLLLATDQIQQTLAGKLPADQYVAFLCQAYHHVKHTVPLLMAAGSRLPPDKQWLQAALTEYINEEKGHDEWILDDIAHCGYDRDKARHSIPNRATEVMIAYAYHIIDRENPLGFFGMVHVLEGTSVTVADRAANSIVASTGLPENAFSYLRSHGALDIEHVDFFKELMTQITEPSDQQAIIHCARNFYHLYADMFRSIEASQAQDLAA